MNKKFSKEIVLLIQTVIITIFGLINMFLDIDYLKVNVFYHNDLVIANLVALYCFLIYYYNMRKEIKKQKADLKRFGLV